jgi:hypothetical protein
MTFWFRPRIRHPFFPGLNPTPTSEAKGRAPALCGAYAELEKAAANGASAERAVFVLIGGEGPPFTAAQRDRLWDLFQTPVYAILTGSDGRIAGFECEVQDGFHLPGKLEADAETICECGRPGPVLDSNASAEGSKEDPIPFHANLHGSTASPFGPSAP